jgi:hypothetical protein
VRAGHSAASLLYRTNGKKQTIFLALAKRYALGWILRKRFKDCRKMAIAVIQ